MNRGAIAPLLAKTLDGEGIYGSLVHYTVAAAFFGSALLLFIYLWRKGRLDMDEGPAQKMLEDEEEKNGGGEGNGERE